MDFDKSSQITNTKQLKDSYDEIYRRAPIKESEEHYRWVTKVLDPIKGKILLDIACGGGHFLAEAEKAGLSTVGLDLSSEALRIAKKKAYQSMIICSDGEALPFKNDIFDYAINLGSLEHFLNPQKGLKEMARVLKKDAKALLLLPNSYFLRTLWNVFKTGATGRTTDQKIDRWATKEEWSQLIEESGLKIQEILKYNYKSPHTSLKYKIVRPFIPLNLSYSFLFSCVKA